MRKAKVTIYKGRDGQWYLRLRANNGRILLKSGDGYKRREDAKKVALYFDLTLVDVPL